MLFKISLVPIFFFIINRFLFTKLLIVLLEIFKDLLKLLSLVICKESRSISIEVRDVGIPTHHVFDLNIAEQMAFKSLLLGNFLLLGEICLVESHFVPKCIPLYGLTDVFYLDMEELKYFLEFTKL